MVGLFVTKNYQSKCGVNITKVSVSSVSVVGNWSKNTIMILFFVAGILAQFFLYDVSSFVVLYWVGKVGLLRLNFLLLDITVGVSTC